MQPTEQQTSAIDDMLQKRQKRKRLEAKKATQPLVTPSSQGVSKPTTPKLTRTGDPMPTTEGDTLSYTCTCTHCGAKARLSFDLRENQLEARRSMYRAFGWVVEWEGCNRCSDCWQQTRHDKNHARQHEKGRP